FKKRAIYSWGKNYNCFNSKNYDYFLEYAIHGCLGIINKWLKDGRKDNPDNLAELLENVVMNGTDFLKMK
ncbi:MAG: TetR-like C-terminal domain-containing protein, partial [Bacilli bacterium]|nr:TetR-like C-terminal domain-containing protein [Bacilli bacterium]